MQGLMQADGVSDHREAALPFPGIGYGKEPIMRSMYFRWILPILALLVVITVIAFASVFAHAAGVAAATKTTTTNTVTTVATTTATPVATGTSTISGAQPDFVFGY